MDQLSGADYVSLFAEKRNVYNHVGTLVIYDVSTAPNGHVRYKDILKHAADRLYLHPVFRKHLVTPPFGLDRPYWVTGTEIDLEYHIRHIALPKPGDWRQLMIQVARLHSRPLDRAHPLWEAYVIEGLDNIPNLPAGAFAIFLKIHHAVVDGMAAINLLSKLHTDTPTRDENDHERLIIGEAEPSAFELFSRSLSNSFGRISRIAKLSSNTAGTLLGVGKELFENKSFNLDQLLGNLKPAQAPITRFSTHVSANRVMEGFGMPISRIKRVRAKVPGVTLNDVFITVAGGAVRKYLEDKGELPEQSLCALMPISLRSEASAGGNAVTGVPVQVCSDIADPIERLHAAHKAAKASMAKAEKMGLDVLKNFFDVLPSAVVSLLIDKLMLPSINMTVSNVRGPDKPMYLAGAKAMCLYPVSIPADGGGLNFTGVSYNGVMWMSMVSCRAMIPDPDVFIDCMRSAWQELLAAADALPDPASVKPLRKPVARRAQSKPSTAKAKVASARKPRSKPA